MIDAGQCYIPLLRPQANGDAANWLKTIKKFFGDDKFSL